jgi:hypothetical protein
MKLQTDANRLIGMADAAGTIAFGYNARRGKV